MHVTYRHGPHVHVHAHTHARTGTRSPHVHAHAHTRSTHAHFVASGCRSGPSRAGSPSGWAGDRAGAGGPGGWWSSAQCPRETASEAAPACPQGAVGWACPNEPRIRMDTLPAPGPTPRHPAWASECELDWQAGAGPPWTPCLVPPTPLRAHVALPARGRTCPTRATAIHNRLQMGP